MKILCVFGKYNYGDPARGKSYEYTHFIPALKSLNHEVIFFESFSRQQYSDFAELNTELIKAVNTSKPDIILFVLMQYEIWIESLQVIKNECDAYRICWSTDDSWKYDQFSRFMASYFDVYVTTYEQAARQSLIDGHQNFFLSQWAADSSRLQNPKPADKCTYEVSFIGTAYGNRVKWVNSLKKSGINVTCFGHGWDHGPVASEEIPGIIRDSVICLNFGDSEIILKGGRLKRSRQIKARTFEVPGAGGFLMTEPADSLDLFYVPDKEIVLFSDIDELTEKIKHYLANPLERDLIANAGYIKTRNHHTYNIRFQQIIDHTLKQPGTASRKADKNARCCNLDLKSFAVMARRHKPSIPLNILRAILVSLCSIAWGKARGPRAARKILFEISWRLAGLKTYSVSGWPGRLFYKES